MCWLAEVVGWLAALSELVQAGTASLATANVTASPQTRN